ncbi:MAG TPA: twin-arginine translocation signal domain-containing protein, partial [Vicinamibacterales bacterium]|nr:twin-arginine translocation signal domain-containing protein [Vicinamibacterales bacterium]
MRKTSVGRRRFLKQAAVTGAAVVATGASPAAAQETPALARPATPGVPPLPRESDPLPAVEVLTTDRPGGDFMVDVLKTLDFEYVAANPGSSFRGLHESLINHGGNRAPEFITCCHEESSVAIA